MRCLLLALAGSAFMLSGCNSGSSTKDGGATTAAAAGGPTTVSTVAVVSKKLSTTIALPAQLLPQTASVWWPTSSAHSLAS